MKQPLNEQFIRMQKIAGIITENKQSSVKDQVDAILSTNINPKLNTFIQPVKFKLDQAFAEDIDIYTILEEAKQEMEFQLERANNNKDLSLIFAKIEALLNNEEAGLNENQINEESCSSDKMLELVKMYVDNYFDEGMGAGAALRKLDEILDGKLDDYDKSFLKGEEDQM